MKTPKNKEIIDHFLIELQSPKKALTEWESNFIESVGNQFYERGSLSDKQFEVLERIYAEKTE